MAAQETSRAIGVVKGPTHVLTWTLVHDGLDPVLFLLLNFSQLNFS